MAECRRIDPNHVGPHCGCFGDACALDAPRPTSDLAADELADMGKRAGWVLDETGMAKSGYAPRKRKLAEWVVALVARVTDLEAQVAALTQERDNCSASHARQYERLEAAEAALLTKYEARLLQKLLTTQVDFPDLEPEHQALYEKLERVL